MQYYIILNYVMSIEIYSASMHSGVFEEQTEYGKK
jgi:hypothetical protein